jgi:hypothetical protein
MQQPIFRQEQIMVRLISVLGALVIATVATVNVSACSVASPANKPVEIADESAIIVWDSASSTQHFIRRATFKSAADDFGFLVPTPTKPELAEVDDAAFKELARITAPKVVKQPRPSGGGCSIGCSNAAAPKGSAAPNAVEVLGTAHVAGYDAVVLQADNADALAKWLREHGYEFSDALKSWADEYIKLKWKITAFKLSKKGAESSVVSSSAVRMTFKTDKPFFPYREPATSGKPGPRLLRVYFVSTERVAGTLGDSPWPGKTVWSKQLSKDDHEKVASQLKLPQGTEPSAWWLTEFEDHSSPRPGTADVYFNRAADQAPVEREPHIQYTASNLGGYMTALAACALVACIRLMRRRRD